MKLRSLTMFVFLIVSSTQLLAASSQHKALNTLLDALVVCPSSNLPTRFVDNGDGTICDHQTGLMWEKKDAADGSVDFHNPHDVDNTYTFDTVSDFFPHPNGSIFIEILPLLNGELGLSAPSEQLGGHNDWRLPTSAELQTILDCSFGVPCIDPIFGPTGEYSYWSSTGDYSGNTIRGWLVNFGDGDVFRDEYLYGYHVRAVRGGR